MPNAIEKAFAESDIGDQHENDLTVAAIDELCAAYLAAKGAAERAEAEAKRRKTRRDELERQLIDTLARAGKKRYESDGHQLTVAERSFYSLPPKATEQDRQNVLRWLRRARGGKHLIEQSVHHSTFNAYCRERAEAKLPIPPAVKIATKKYVQVR